MKIFRALLPLLITFIFISCDDNQTDPLDEQKHYKLTGTVYQDGQPVEGADVQISAAINWLAKTDASGRFTINNISAGEHPVTIKKVLDGNKVVGQNLTIALVQDSTDLGQIDLPAIFGDISVDGEQLAQSRITVNWTKSNDPNFTEYKVFRKDYSEIDNVVGELIFQTTDINQLSYIDETFNTGKTMYYRVYAYSGNKYSGTAPSPIDVPEVNLLLNSGFETAISGNLPEYWVERISGNPSFKYFTISNENVKLGSNSLKIYYDDSQANPVAGRTPWGGLIQTIANSNLIVGKEYTLSFWEKSVIGGYQVRIAKNGDLENPIILYEVPSGKDWTLQKFNFKIDSETTYIDIVISTKPSQSVGGIVTCYLDDIKLIK